MRRSSPVCLLALCALAEGALAQTTVPNTFTSGTPARAAEVNANFQAVAAAIDGLASRVSRLEGGAVTDADVVGTYRTSVLQIGIGQVATGIGDVEAISYDGTWTFAADQTFAAAFTGRKNDSSGPSPDDGAIEGTWSRTGNNVTITITSEDADDNDIVFHCAAGCRVMFGTGADGSSGVGDEGLNNLLLLARVD